MLFLTVKDQPNRCSSRSIALRALFSATVLNGTIASAAAAGVTVQKPWMQRVVRERPAAGYFMLRNDTDTTIKLTGASSTDCGQITFRQSKRLNGVERSLPVKSVSVPSHDKFRFHQSGFHLVCMDPHRTIVVGHKVPVILKFADGKTVTAQFLVKGPRGNQQILSVRAAQ